MALFLNAHTFAPFINKEAPDMSYIYMDGCNYLTEENYTIVIDRLIEVAKNIHHTKPNNKNERAYLLAINSIVAHCLFKHVLNRTNLRMFIADKTNGDSFKYILNDTMDLVPVVRVDNVMPEFHLEYLKFNAKRRGTFLKPHGTLYDILTKGAKYKRTVLSSAIFPLKA